MEERRVAIVTGASRGIGSVTAKALAKTGYRIVINDIVEDEKAQDVLEEIKALGGEATYYRCDVTNFAACGEMVKATVKEYGHLDAVVCNAGITRDGLILNMPEEDFDRVISVNLKGAFNLARHASSPMQKKRSGRIVMVSSVIGLMGNSGQANYAASKAGLIGLAKSVAKELAARNITCNLVAPGYIATDMTAVLPEEVKAEMIKRIPMGRYGTAEDVANVIAFLCSDAAQYVTGEVIRVDGGMAM